LGSPNDLPDSAWPSKVCQITREKDYIGARQLRADGCHVRGGHVYIAERHDFHGGCPGESKEKAVLLDL